MSKLKKIAMLDTLGRKFINQGNVNHSIENKFFPRFQ